MAPKRLVAAAAAGEETHFRAISVKLYRIIGHPEWRWEPAILSGSLVLLRFDGEIDFLLSLLGKLLVGQWQWGHENEETIIEERNPSELQVDLAKKKKRRRR